MADHKDQLVDEGAMQKMSVAPPDEETPPETQGRADEQNTPPATQPESSALDEAEAHPS